MSRQREKPGARPAPPAIFRKVGAVLDSPILTGLADLPESPDDGSTIVYEGGTFSWQSPIP